MFVVTESLSVKRLVNTLTVIVAVVVFVVVDVLFIKSLIICLKKPSHKFYFASIYILFFFKYEHFEISGNLYLSTHQDREKEDQNHVDYVCSQESTKLVFPESSNEWRVGDIQR